MVHDGMMIELCAGGTAYARNGLKNASAASKCRLLWQAKQKIEFLQACGEAVVPLALVF